MDLLHHLEKGKEELSPLQYHIKSLHIISRHYKKSLLRSQIYHGYEELSMDTNYPNEEDKKKEASMRCSLLHGSWDQILQRCPSVLPSVRPSFHYRCPDDNLNSFHQIKKIFSIFVTSVKILDWIWFSYLIKYVHNGRSCDLDIFGIPEVIFSVRAFKLGRLRDFVGHMM